MAEVPDSLQYVSQGNWQNLPDGLLSQRESLAHSEQGFHARLEFAYRDPDFPITCHNSQWSKGFERAADALETARAEFSDSSYKAALETAARDKEEWAKRRYAEKMAIPDNVKAEAVKAVTETSAKTAVQINAEKAEQVSKNFDASRTAEMIQRATQPEKAPVKNPGLDKG